MSICFVCGLVDGCQWGGLFFYAGRGVECGVGAGCFFYF